MTEPLHVMIVGGGVGGLETLLALRGLVADRARLSLVTEADHFSWRAQAIAQSFGAGSLRRHPMALIAADLDAELVRDEVDRVLTDAHEVHLAGGARIGYDVLVLATGAVAVPAFEHGLTVADREDPEAFEELLDDLEHGFVGRLGVVVPPGATWSLPAYELALRVAAAGRPGAVTVISEEQVPAQAFGGAAATTVRACLDAAGVAFKGATTAQLEDDTRVRANGHWLIFDRLVSLPAFVGPRLRGVPADPRGFVRTDPAGCVLDAGGDVFAVGDMTAGPIKQGGLAAQQAELVGAAVAERCGVRVPHHAPDLVLRGLLPTARGPLYLQARLGDPDRTSVASWTAPWSPPSGVAAPRLAGYLEAGDPDVRATRFPRAGDSLPLAASDRSG